MVVRLVGEKNANNGNDSYLYLHFINFFLSFLINDFQFNTDMRIFNNRIKEMCQLCQQKKYIHNRRILNI